MRLLFVLILAAAIPLTAAQKKPPLYGWMVVLDPGHGGTDPGSSGNFAGKRVVEDEYVYDVALRAQRIIKSMGGLALLTIQDRRTGERSPRAQEVFPDYRGETYTGRTSVVRAGTWGLNQRLAYGNMLNRKYPKHNRAWISIHFDVVGRNRQIEGVRVIKSRTSTKLAEALRRSFGAYNWLREFAPVVENGDDAYGIRSLHILNGGNRFREKVLIELGNFNNTTDVWRVRNPVTREAYARAIATSLVGW
ncbi:hypothetical protein A2818_00815 [Candidatus Nomurabacteria bacterium RIFCSPHIGHO2_01_FULL_40_12]|uniref:MurNAc-LAA domain-containing protein n=1 Tax=Candidatus Nomurabacteria bacterium RIFCSPHIGHO2_01_FULL_40_12 TaxID=1801737 RepID=A0A1F6UZG8_9BACT|nr:MAG: hypothetical protein A2818_00815 [Candidatus Nomurabacteria bacterium RIFCSPHIGHO2_01_FULL_40_12]